MFPKYQDGDSSSGLASYTKGQIIAFKTAASIELILFSLAMGVLLFNVYFYLIKQRTYRIYFVATFYLFSFLTFTFRLALCVGFLLALGLYDSENYKEHAEIW